MGGEYDHVISAPFDVAYDHPDRSLLDNDVQLDPYFAVGPCQDHIPGILADHDDRDPVRTKVRAALEEREEYSLFTWKNIMKEKSPSSGACGKHVHVPIGGGFDGLFYKTNPAI